MKARKANDGTYWVSSYRVRNLIGVGITEQEAIDDLLRLEKEFYDPNDPCGSCVRERCDDCENY